MNVDECISKLLSVRSSPPGTEVSLPEEFIIKVVKAAREVFLMQPMLLEISGKDRIIQKIINYWGHHNIAFDI